MHSPDCDFMAFGKTNFTMLLGSGPSKKFNMQSFFKTLRNGLKARRVSYWKTLVWSEINDRSRSGFSFRLLVVPKEPDVDRAIIGTTAIVMQRGKVIILD